MRRRLAEYVMVLAIVAAGAYLVAWYYRLAPITLGVTVEAKPAPEVKHEHKVDVPLNKPAKAYGPAVKTKLKLPESIANDPNQHVITSIKTPNDERQHTITTVINDKTGESTTFDRVEQLPWMAIDTKTELGIYAGLKHGEQAIRIEAKQALLQVKALHLGAVASADLTRSGTDGFIGIGGWVRW